jgi:hypothetical protein
MKSITRFDLRLGDRLPWRSKRNPRPKAAQNPNSNPTYAIAPKERGEKKQGRLTSLEGELIVDNETRAPQSRTALTHRPSRTKLTALTHNTHGTHAQHSQHSLTTLTAGNKVHKPYVRRRRTTAEGITHRQRRTSETQRMFLKQTLGATSGGEGESQGSEATTPVRGCPGSSRAGFGQPKNII